MKFANLMEKLNQDADSDSESIAADNQKSSMDIDLSDNNETQRKISFASTSQSSFLEDAV